MSMYKLCQTLSIIILLVIEIDKMHVCVYYLARRIKKPADKIMARREDMERRMAKDERPVREYMDNGREQYELGSFYEKYIVAPQMKDYDAMYKFSRGNTECPSHMHGEMRNEQEGP